MCISPTNMHWRERPTTSGQKSLEKEELFTLEENLRWTSASSARLFLSWAQASPSVLEEEKDNDQCPSLAHRPSWDLSDKPDTTLCTIFFQQNHGKRWQESEKTTNLCDQGRILLALYAADLWKQSSLWSETPEPPSAKSFRILFLPQQSSHQCSFSIASSTLHPTSENRFSL